MHACAYVLIKGKKHNIEFLVDRALAPFDEEQQVRPYKLHLTRSVVQQMARHHRLKADDLKSLVPKVHDWVGGLGGIDEIGLFTTKTDNPHGKWDWYEIGGRWDGYLTGRTPPPTEPGSGPIEGNAVPASTLLKDPKLPSRLPAAVVTPTGEWVEKESFINTYCGWFVAERTNHEWLLAVRRILAAFPGHMVVCVDVHY